MRVGPIIDHLRQAGTGYLDVDGAAELPEAIGNPRRLPRAFVVPGDEVPRGGRQAGCVRQRVGYRFSVVSMVRNVAGDTNAAGNDELDGLRRPMIAAVHDFRHPDGTVNPIRIAGRLAAVDNRILVFEDEFEFEGTETYEVST